MSDGFCPFAVRREIPPGPNDPRITPRVAILHVDAMNSESLFGFFNGPSKGVESHFYVTKGGTIEQYRSIEFQADANHEANGFAVSIETQGFGHGEWTSAQLASIKRLLLWLHTVTDGAIPLRPCPAWDQPGVGYHVMFGAPGRWTPVSKSCPGPERVQQFTDDIVPWLREEDTMPTLDEIETMFRTMTLNPPGDEDKLRLTEAIGQTWNRTAQLEAEVADLKAAVKALRP